MAKRMGSKPRAIPGQGRNDKRANDVKSVLDRLRTNGSAKLHDTIDPRYGIVVKNAFGVTMTQLKLLAKITGRYH